MKKVIVLLFLLSILSTSSAQMQSSKPRYLKQATLFCPIDLRKKYSKYGLILGNKNTIDTSHILIQNLIKFNVQGSSTGDSKVVLRQSQEVRIDTLLSHIIIIKEGNAFNIVGKVGSYSIVKFWDLNKVTAQGLLGKLIANHNKENELEEMNLDKPFDITKIKGLIATNGSDYFDLTKTYYLVPTETLLSSSIEFDYKTGSWDIGLLAMPVKIRPFAREKGQFDFTGGLSLGTTFSWTVHQKWNTNFTHNLLFYIGISSYTADSTKIKEKRTDYNIATFTPAIGWMWEKNNIQLSILTGIDFPAGKLQQNWVYRNQPWFGFGIGFGLFKINKEDAVTNGENK